MEFHIHVLFVCRLVSACLLLFFSGVALRAAPVELAPAQKAAGVLENAPEQSAADD